MSGNDAWLNNYLVLGALLFSLGAVGFLTRRNLIVIFLCAELMLQGVSTTLVGFSGFHGTWGGQVTAIFSLALALFVVLFKRGFSLDVSIWSDLREEDQPPVEDEPLGDEPVETPRQWPHLAPAGRLPERRTGGAASPAPRRETVAAGEGVSRNG